jgi:hypothetical protein
MKRFIIWIVLCIAILVALGSLRPAHDCPMEINYHDSYLGAIQYNEYGISNNDQDQANKQIILSIIPLVFILIYKKNLKPHIPKPRLYCSVKIIKQREKLLPKLYHSNLIG